jgi:hypothetical protein
MLPAQLGGSNIGRILAAMVPDSFIYILALLVLLFASYVTINKGLHKWHEETEKLQQARDEKQRRQSISRIGNETGNSKNEITQSNILDEAHYAIEIEEKLENDDEGRGSFRSRQLSQQLVAVIQEQINVYSVDSSKLQVPWLVIGTIAIMWTIYTVIITARAFVSKCTDPYIALQIIVYIPLFFAHFQASRLNTKQALEKSRNSSSWFSVIFKKSDNDSSSPLLEESNDREGLKRVEENNDVAPGDIDFDKHLIPLILMAYGVGVVCTMLGIGGGEIFSPIILSYHVIPQVTSATTATMSVLNSLAQMVRDGSAGDFDLTVGGILLAVGFTGGMTGRQLGLWISARYGRSSVIIFFLAAGLFVSCIYYIYTLGTAEFNSQLHGFC